MTVSGVGSPSSGTLQSNYDMLVNLYKWLNDYELKNFFFKGPKTWVIVFLSLRSELWIEFELWREKETCDVMTCGMNNLQSDWSLFSALM